MLFAGRIWKDGSHWLAEVPLLDVMTQGKTRTEAGAMLKDAIESLVNKDRFAVRVVDRGGDEVAVESDDVATLFATSLKRLREANGLSMADVAERLGQSSKTGYARYEQGLAVPALDKAGELLRAVAPDMPVTIDIGHGHAGPRKAKK